MPPPEFNERQFEFCANYELQQAVGAYLVGGVPAIPSQLQEAVRGYDAAYRFASGRVLFIQYKIAHFAGVAWGPGAATFRLWSAPYYRAHLHRDRHGLYTQHNTLVGLASSSTEALYISPCFYERGKLLGQFASGSGAGVLNASLLAPLSGVPLIHDVAAHSITYPEDGRAFRVHSEPSEPFDARPSLENVVERIEETRWNVDFWASLANRLRRLLVEHDVPPPEPPTAPGFDGPLAELGAVLDQRAGAVMALVPSVAKTG